VPAAATLAAGLTAGVGGWQGGREPSLLIGFPDCEVPGGGVTVAWTSLVFVVAGIWIAGDGKLISRPSRLLFASTIGSVGTGSFFGHAALTDGAPPGWIPLAIKLMLVTFIVAAIGRLRSWQQPAALPGRAGLAASTIAL